MRASEPGSGPPLGGERSDGVADRPISVFRRHVYIGVAGFFFLLGAAGAILPGLPATPFLLLTSYFLVRVSPHLNERLLRTPPFGPILLDWQQRGGVRPNVKLRVIAVVALAVALTVSLSTIPSLLKLVVAALAAIGIVVIARLPNARNLNPEHASGECAPPTHAPEHGQTVR
jgi:uncharacterized membrane protein YbaN (DUF454 family)